MWTRLGCPIRKHVKWVLNSNPLKVRIVIEWENEELFTFGIPIARGFGSHSIDRALSKDTNANNGAISQGPSRLWTSTQTMLFDCVLVGAFS